MLRSVIQWLFYKLSELFGYFSCFMSWRLVIEGYFTVRHKKSMKVSFALMSHDVNVWCMLQIYCKCLNVIIHLVNEFNCKNYDRRCICRLTAARLVVSHCRDVPCVFCIWEHHREHPELVLVRFGNGCLCSEHYVKYWASIKCCKF